MILLFRLTNKKTGEVLTPKKIEFHLGRPIIIDDYSINAYDLELLDANEGWTPVTMAFGEEEEIKELS